MKHVVLILSIFFAGFAWAGEMALVYENEAAVTQGKAVLTNITNDGALVSAQLAMKAGANLLIGPLGGDLRKGSLVRLDNDLDLAVVRLGEPVANATLQSAHQKKSKSVVSFLPSAAEAVAVPAIPVTPVPTAVTPAEQPGPVQLSINGIPLSSEKIELKSSALRKSKFNIGVVMVSTTGVWNLSVELRSDPKLGFWKPGRKTGLNETPDPVFKYTHQVLFVQMKAGKGISIPAEAHYVDKDKEYQWTITVKSKQFEFTQTVPVVFH